MGIAHEPLSDLVRSVRICRLVLFEDLNIPMFDSHQMHSRTLEHLANLT